MYLAKHIFPIKPTRCPLATCGCHRRSLWRPWVLTGSADHPPQGSAVVPPGQHWYGKNGWPGEEQGERELEEDSPGPSHSAWKLHLNSSTPTWSLTELHAKRAGPGHLLCWCQSWLPSLASGLPGHCGLAWTVGSQLTPVIMPIPALLSWPGTMGLHPLVSCCPALTLSTCLPALESCLMLLFPYRGTGEG